METPTIEWTEEGEGRSARWRSERGAPAPKQVRVVDDRATADDSYGLACQGVALLWRGDFQNARQMLTAMATRADRIERKGPKPKPGSKPAAVPEPKPAADAFNLVRQARAQRARTLGMLLVPLEAD